MYPTLHFSARASRPPSALQRGLQVEFTRFELVFAAAAPGRARRRAAAAATPPALLALHTRLQAAFASNATEARIFRPHLTLARHAAGSLPPGMTTPLRWNCGVSVGFRARPRPGYRIVARYC
jgi:2'-5' RNA ligase